MRAKVKEAARSSGRKAKFSQMSTFDKTFTVCGDILLFLFVLCIIVPMVYIVIASFMDPVMEPFGFRFDPILIPGLDPLTSCLRIDSEIDRHIRHASIDRILVDLKDCISQISSI